VQASLQVICDLNLSSLGNHSDDTGTTVLHFINDGKPSGDRVDGSSG